MSDDLEPVIDSKEQSEFNEICLNTKDQEITYTIEAIRDSYQLSSCSDIFALLSTTARLEFRNTGKVDPLNLPAQGIPKNRRIVDISILKFARNVTILDLWNNAVNDLRPLGGLKNLRELNLTGNNVIDLSPLSALTGLKVLDLSRNISLSDASHLASLASLERLYLDSTKISDISPLVNLGKLSELSLLELALPEMPYIPTLKQLSLGRCSPALLPAISRLINLEKLDLQLASPGDLLFLSPLTQLKDLRLLSSGTPDLAPIGLLKGLTALDLRLSRPAGSDVSGLAANYAKLGSLKDLSSLSVYDADLQDVSFLTAMPNLSKLSLRRYPSNAALIGSLAQLKTLFLQGGPGANYQFLAKLARLEELTIFGQGASNLNSITALKDLKSLSLEYFDAVDLGLLAGLTKLEALSLSNTVAAINDIAPLNALVNLKRLRLASNQGTFSLKSVPNLTKMVALDFENSLNFDIAGIEKMIALETISLYGSANERCTHIAGLGKLRFVDASASNLTDLSCFQKLDQLVRLDLNFNQDLKDTDVLSKLINLEVVNLNSTAVTSIEPLRDLRFLREIDLGFSAVKDLRPLIGNARLSSLNIEETPISSQARNEGNCSATAKSEALRAICRP